MSARVENSEGEHDAVIPSTEKRCPNCGYQGPFKTHKRTGRPNATCPKCGFKERHRLLTLLYNSQDFFSDKKVLHIGPEFEFAHYFKNSKQYVTADLDQAGVDLNFDLTKAPLESGSFDVIVINHVLEHIPQDQKALEEMFRILSPGGLAIITVPVEKSYEITFEDPKINTPELREIYYGRHDHVRFYGRDIVEKVSNAGFRVDVFQVDPILEVSYGLHRGATAYLAHKQ
ncbi:MAG: methyltransferase domain-containing protein [Pseudomonadota bacterium]